MDRKIKWRTFWLALLVVLALVALLPTFVPTGSMPAWYPQAFNKKVQLGLDLQGGSYIVYSIDLDKAIADEASRLKKSIEAGMNEQGLEGRVTTPAEPLGAVTVILDDPTEENRRKFIEDILVEEDQRIDADYECPPGEQAPEKICTRVSSDHADGIRDAALEQSVLIIRDRINLKGVSEPSVKRKGDQIIVELPGEPEAIEPIKDLITKTASLQFKMVDNSSDGEFKDRTGSAYMKKLFRQVAGATEGQGDPRARELGITAATDGWVHDESGTQHTDYYLMASDEREQISIDEAKALGIYDSNLSEVAPGKVERVVTGRERIEQYLDELAEKDPSFAIDDDHEIKMEYVRPRAFGDEPSREPYWRTYYLTRPVELSGERVEESFVQWDPQTNKPAVLVRFDRIGGREFGDMTSRNVGRKMAIILDGTVKSAPVIQTAITGGASQITMGGGTVQEIQKEADDLVQALKTGSLRAPIKEESSSDLGAMLGEDAIKKAQLSFVVGTILVILIMVFIYRVAGTISIVALALNILFMLAILAAFGATLTLPGIAAVVLTVGMAVDANVIIYERVREELRAGKSIRGAVDAGFSRAFAAIFDGQLTTAVAGYVLLTYGSGPIQGFAVMLLIGIVTTLFTATWCTRLFFEYYVGKGRKVKQLAI